MDKKTNVAFERRQRSVTLEKGGLCGIASSEQKPQMGGRENISGRSREHKSESRLERNDAIHDPNLSMLSDEESTPRNASCRLDRPQEPPRTNRERQRFLCSRGSARAALNFMGLLGHDVAATSDLWKAFKTRIQRTQICIHCHMHCQKKRL